MFQFLTQKDTKNIFYNIEKVFDKISKFEIQGHIKKLISNQPKQSTFKG